MRSSAVFAAILMVPPALADFKATDWKWRRAAGGVESGLAAVRLDKPVYASSRRDLADLRLVRGGRDVPYVLTTLEGLSREVFVPAEITDIGATDEGIELVMDVKAARRHSRLRLATERTNYRQSVRIETSDDKRKWAVARRDGAIFDFTQDSRHVASLEIDYPQSTRRYLRVTVLGWTDPKAITGGAVLLVVERPPVREVFGEGAPKIAPEARRTLAEFDLGTPGLPVDRVTADIADSAFDRAVVVEVSADGKEWTTGTWSRLSRFVGGECLDVSLPEQGFRFIRLGVWNGDDKPLTIRGLRFAGLSRLLKFEGAPGDTWLYYGNAQASFPEYDLARRMPAGEPATAALGPETPNPDFREPPKPFTEQRPGLLWALMGVSIAVLGGVTWKLIQSMKAPGA